MKYEALSSINRMSLKEANIEFGKLDRRKRAYKGAVEYNERIRSADYNNIVAMMDQLAHRIGYLKKKHEK